MIFILDYWEPTLYFSLQYSLWQFYKVLNKTPFPKSHKGIMMNTSLYLWRGSRLMFFILDYWEPTVSPTTPSLFIKPHSPKVIKEYVEYFVRYIFGVVLVQWFLYWIIENLRYIFLYNILYDNFIRFSIKLYKTPFPKSHKGIYLRLRYIFGVVLVE